MFVKRFEVVCSLTIFIRLALGEVPQFECNYGSLNLSLLEDNLGFIKIGDVYLIKIVSAKKISCGFEGVPISYCGSPIVAQLSIDVGSDESCEAIQKLKIVPKGEWQVSEGRTKVEDLSSPADYVVINMLPHPYPVGGDYRRKLQNIQSEHNINHGNLLYNFIITDDGTIYEGLGWDKKNVLFSGGLNSVRIRFMTEKSAVAPGPAIQAFKFLVRAGKCRGSIAPNYKLIPHSYIRDYIPYTIYNMEFELLKQLDNLDNDKNFGNECGVSPPTSVTYREEWGIRLDESKLLRYDSTIDIVIVRDFNARCFTLKNCHSTLDYYRDRGKLEDINFFLGEDGQIYEYLGWEFTEKDWFKSRRAIIVSFIGTFSNYEPSKKAFSILDKFLRHGVSWGYLSKNYIISSYRLVKDDPSFAGNALHNELKKLDHFTDRI